MKIVRANDCRTTPWKNGGGATIEIEVGPRGASLDDFDWRVSMARIASDGPFSEFHDIDRTLALVRGSGLALTIGNAAPIVLERGSAPIRFAGDVPAHARLLGGEVTDLNVMTRRRRFEHRLKRIGAPENCDFNGYDIAITVACSGSIMLTAQQETITLADGDAAVLARTSESGFGVVPVAPAEGYLVQLRKHRDQAGRG